MTDSEKKTIAHELTTENVRETMLKCLFREEELQNGKPPDDAVMVDGIMRKFAFHPGRLAEQKSWIAEMLSQLEDSFFEHKGGGASFLRACCTRDEEQWGEHTNMEELFALGVGAGLAKCVLPRELWAVLPGGMPYYSIAAEVAP